MDSQSELKAISVDPKAYFFFPTCNSHITQKNSKRQPSIVKALDFTSMAKSNTMNIKKRNLLSSNSSWQKATIN